MADLRLGVLQPLAHDTVFLAMRNQVTLNAQVGNITENSWSPEHVDPLKIGG